MKGWLTPLLVLPFLFTATVVSAQSKTAKTNPLDEAALEFSLRADQIKSLEGKSIRLVPSTGEPVENAVVKKITTTKDGDRFKTIDVQVEGKGAVRKFPGDKLREVEVEGLRYRVRAVPSQKVFVLEDGVARREAIEKRIGENEAFWEPKTEEERAEFLAGQKGDLDKVEAHFPRLKMTRRETDHFLLMTDGAPEPWAGRLQVLEKTIEVLEQTLQIPRGSHVCPGKIRVICFRDRSDLNEYQKHFLKDENPSEDFLITLNYDDWDVVILTLEGQSPSYLTYSLVHFTARVYLGEYPTSFLLPGWLDVAAADWIAGLVLPAEKRPGGGIASTQLASAQEVRNAGSLDRYFDEEEIYPEHWGVASAMADMLVKVSPERFLLLVTRVKEGHPWAECLESIFGMTRAELARAYGRQIGVPNLSD